MTIEKLQLKQYNEYSRESVHDILDPLVSFTPQSGTWGLQGIIRLSESNGDYVFFVTLGSSQADHNFDEGITEEGILTWQSQPKMDFKNKTIKDLISFDEKENNLYLFFRTKKGTDYTYLGKLSYLVHDAERIKPVYFKWKILDWNAERTLKIFDDFEFIKESGIYSNDGKDRNGVTTEKFCAYREIEIIDKEAETLINTGSKDSIDLIIKEFVKWIEKNEKNEVIIDEKRQKFVEDFPIKTIQKMTKDDYVVGLGRKDTFCYRLENELKELGDLHGAPAFKFGIYYGISGEDTESKYRVVRSKFGDDPDKAFENIREQIISLIVAGNNNDQTAIKDSKLAPTFRGKILSTYFPQTYLGIFSKEHLDYFLSRIGIETMKNDDELDKQLLLLSWKESNVVLREWPMHTFERFLYLSYGNPSELQQGAKKEQKEKDNNYPRDYVTNIGIKICQWEELLQNRAIFSNDNIELLKRIYLFDNHAATCKELSIQDGVSSSTYISPMVALSRRISKHLNLPPIKGTDGKETFWRVLFWGKFRENGEFEWKLRPKLANSLVKLYPELELEPINEEEDNSLIEDLRKTAVIDQNLNFEYEGKPKKKQEPIYSNGSKTYPRDRKIAMNALAHAKYNCEINNDHPTFKRKKSNINYTEPHHLVPMAFSDEFNISLDVEENIVSLCSNCHNQLHYGQGVEELIKSLYGKRKDDLQKVGINITFDELKGMYE